jgi:hypothetical protein
MEVSDEQIKDVTALMVKGYGITAIAGMLNLKTWNVQYLMNHISTNRLFNQGAEKGNITMYALRKLEKELFENIEKLSKDPNNAELNHLVKTQTHKYAHALIQ